MPGKLAYNVADVAVAIIDGDAMSAGLVDNFCKELGVREVGRFSDGAAGWEAIRHGNYHLVVVDWVVTQVSGLALFNRMRRSEKLSLTPVIVTTATLNKHEFALLGEYPCSTLVPKPLSRPEFESAFKLMMSEYTSYRSNYELIDNLMNAIHYDGSNAEATFDKLWTRLPNPIPVAIMGARMLRERGILDVAERVLRKALEFNHKMIPIISELGKVLHMQGKLAEATRVLNHAQSFSPKNVDRLLLLGEIHLQETEPEKAREYFRAVMEIDPRDKKAFHGQTVSQNIAAHIAGQGRGEKMSQSFASLLNILAINLVRNRKHADGIRQYEAAMSFVHTDPEAARLCFNLGLGYMRWGKPDRAIEWFAKCSRVEGPCCDRAKRYVEEIEKKFGIRRGSNDASITTIIEHPAAVEADLGSDTEHGQETVITDSPGQKRLLARLGEVEQLDEAAMPEEDDGKIAV